MRVQSVECAAVRESVSAQLDGEVGPADLLAVRAHLDECSSCRAWRDAAHELTRQARLGGPLPGRDLTAAVLAAAGPRRRAPLPLARAGLVAAAAAQLAISLALLVHGERVAGQHAAHELACFDVGVGVAFLVAALRPRLSAALAWPVGVSVLGLVATALADLAGGETIGVDEAQHLVAVAGVLLLIHQARGPRPWSALLRLPARHDRRHGSAPQRADVEPAALPGAAGAPARDWAGGEVA